MENLSSRFVLRIKFLITSFRNGIMGEFKLSGFSSDGRETGGAMLSVTGLNRFYYVRDFTDMRCKHSRVLSIIREQNESC